MGQAARPEVVRAARGPRPNGPRRVRASPRRVRGVLQLRGVQPPGAVPASGQARWAALEGAGQDEVAPSVT